MSLHTRPDQPQLRLFRYREADYSEADIADLSAMPDKTGFVHWLDIVAPNKPFLSQLADHFSLHPLARDFNEVAGSRPALYEFDGQLMLTARMIAVEGLGTRSEVVGLILGPGYVISLQEEPEDVFEPIRERLRQKIGWIRNRGADHLLYRLLDAICDQYFLVAEYLEDKTEEIMEGIEPAHPFW